VVTDPRIHVRPARPEDAAGIKAMAGSLSPQSVRLRFMGGVSRDSATEELCHEIIAGHTEGEAFVAEDEAGKIVGEAYAAYLNPTEAEAAFVVSDVWQHHGVGSALRSALFEQLRSEGITVVHLETLAENRSLLQLVRDANLPTKERFADGTITIRVDLSPQASL
jgi:GNAT superfamily N-acetyltransferase